MFKPREIHHFIQGNKVCFLWSPVNVVISPLHTVRQYVFILIRLFFLFPIGFKRTENYVRSIGFPSLSKYLQLSLLPSNKARLKIVGHEANYERPPRSLQRILCDLNFAR